MSVRLQHLLHQYALIKVNPDYSVELRRLPAGPRSQRTIIIIAYNDLVADNVLQTLQHTFPISPLALDCIPSSVLARRRWRWWLCKPVLIFSTCLPVYLAARISSSLTYARVLD